MNFDYTTATKSESTYRAFYDFCNFSDGLRDRNGILLTSDQYVVSPIVLFKTSQNPDNDDNSCLVTLDFKSGMTMTGCNILVVGFYNYVLSMNYDEYGKYTIFSVY